jgi:U4/U6 small nuclear ribonucleoprotein PRP3
MSPRNPLTRVCRVKILSDPSHRFKVRKNAEQFGLSGICIFNPQFSLVIVEGSAKAVKQYSRLMLVRIPWTEAARDKDLPMLDENNEELEPIVIKKEGGDAETSLENNRCDKVWEGPLRDRSFNTFRAKRCPTDSIAKDTLGQKLASYWDVAKAFVPEEEL